MRLSTPLSCMESNFYTRIPRSVWFLCHVPAHYMMRSLRLFPVHEGLSKLEQLRRKCSIENVLFPPVFSYARWRHYRCSWCCHAYWLLSSRRAPYSRHPLFAFNDTMLRGYEGRIAIYQNQLIKHISDLGGKPINVSELFNLYSFDVMGDLAFGTSFNMLQNSEQHWTVKLSHKGNGASWLDAAFVVLQTVACNPWRCWRLVYVQGLLLPKTRRNNECR